MLAATIVFFSLFVFCFTCNIASQVGIKMNSVSIRFPLGGKNSFDVGEDGSIYCSSQAYSRVQVFDSLGEFQRGWFVPISKGTFNLKYSKDGLIKIYHVSGKLHRVFDTSGNDIELSYVESEDQESDTNERTDAQGNIYKLVKANYFPQIIKIEPSGKRTVLVSDPFARWFLKGHLPVILFFILSFIFTVILVSQFAKYKCPEHKKI